MTTKKNSKRTTRNRRKPARPVFTQKEAAFMLNLLGNLSINPAVEDAAETVTTVQTIRGKLEPMAPQIKEE